MRRLTYIICLTALLAGSAIAQTTAAQTTKEHHGQGYGFVAPGAVNDGSSSSTMHFGVGGEGLIYKGLGVGGEIGYAIPTRRPEDGFGIFSANGSYHFRHASASGKLVPFVTGGYSLFFRSSTGNAVNFGGGVNYWFREHAGIRAEFRDHVLTVDRNLHYFGFRIGFTFR